MGCAIQWQAGLGYFCRHQGILLRGTSTAVSVRLFSLAGQLVYPAIFCYKD